MMTLARNNQATKRVGLCFTVLSLLLTGCGIKTANVTPTSITGEITGTVHGNQQPIAASEVQFYAIVANRGPFTATPLLSTPVLTDAQGGFSLPKDLVCPSGSAWVYATSMGGWPVSGQGAENSSAALLSLVGRCDELSASNNISINEITTVASVSALAPYLSTNNLISYSNSQSNAFDAAAEKALQLANPLTGTSPGANLQDGVVAPAAKLNSLANLTASCINSGGGKPGDGTPCGRLFLLTNTGADASPTNTVQALLAIALNPTKNVADIYQHSLAALTFSPALASAPGDWSLEMEQALDVPTLAPSVSGSVDSATAVVPASVTSVAGKTSNASSPVYATRLMEGSSLLQGNQRFRNFASVGRFTASISPKPTLSSRNTPVR